MAQANHPPNDRKRVKVYELKNNEWHDRGTGFCAGQVVGVRTIFLARGVKRARDGFPARLDGRAIERECVY